MAAIQVELQLHAARIRYVLGVVPPVKLFGIFGSERGDVSIAASAGFIAEGVR